MLQQGIQPDIIVCRTEHDLTESVRDKISLFCNVERASVIESKDASTIYEVPFNMLKEGLDIQVLKKLGLTAKGEPNLEKWKSFLYKLKNPLTEVTIGLVGKYVELKDAYKSISEAFIHAGATLQCNVKLKWIHSEDVEEKQNSLDEILGGLNGILVAPGFGSRGIEGKILAVKYARENKIPFLGICLGMQCAVIEFARNVLGFKDAHSVEMMGSTTHPVIDMMETQKHLTNMGGTMRLGAYQCELKKGSKVFEAYGEELISERHRHRYEFNSEFLSQFEAAGMQATGVNPTSKLVEVVEIPEHPYFVGVQYHPEYRSTVEEPSPLFISFVKAASKMK